MAVFGAIAIRVVFVAIYFYVLCSNSQIKKLYALYWKMCFCEQAGANSLGSPLTPTAEQAEHTQF